MHHSGERKRSSIYDLSLEALADLCRQEGWRPHTRDQILLWLYRRKVESFEAMTNLSNEVRAVLGRRYEIGRLALRDEISADDGTRKFLFGLWDGQAVESVLMPQKGRVALCVSTQIGCAMRCRFCKTAEMGLVRNLTQGEILGQVLEAQRMSERPITNVVFMGMGEPLHNFDNVVEACRILIDKRAFGIAPRKVTVSTVGLTKKIADFRRDVPVKLAISLNATEDEFRDEIMPVNQAHPLEELIASCRALEFRKREKLTFEYVLFAGRNDSPDDARRLVGLLQGIPVKINLIPYNEYPGSPYRRPSLETIERFHHSLADRGLQVNIRWSKGDAIMAGCGQLCTSIPTRGPEDES